MTLKWIKKDDT